MVEKGRWDIPNIVELELGSDAKLYINKGTVKVNGIIATERGKKIHHGDVVTVQNIGEFKVLQKQ